MSKHFIMKNGDHVMSVDEVKWSHHVMRGFILGVCLKSIQVK